MTVQLLEDTPLALFLGELCECHGYSYEWIEDQEPNLAKHDRKRPCITDNYVPFVVPVLSGEATSSSSTSAPVETPLLEIVRRDLLQDLPEWLENLPKIWWTQKLHILELKTAGLPDITVQFFPLVSGSGDTKLPRTSRRHAESG